MAINPAMIMKLMNEKNKFEATHPKVFPFIQTAFGSGIEEGTIIEMKVKKTDGQTMECNFRVQPSDLELFATLKEMGLNQS